MSDKKEKPTNWMNSLNNNDVQSMFLNETVTCANDVYNKSLVATGQAKNINEAKKIDRMVSCSCPKCSNKFL